MNRPIYNKLDINGILNHICYTAGSIKKEYRIISSLTIRTSEDESYLREYQKLLVKVKKAKVLGIYDQYLEYEPGLFFINDLLIFFDGEASGLSIDVVAVGKQLVMPEDCSDLFSGLSVETFSFENVDTSNTRNMSRMFYNCKIENLDISCFDTRNVSSTSSMFAYCCFQEIPIGLLKPHTRKQWYPKLEKELKNSKMHKTSLDISNCDFRNVSDARDMFFPISVNKIVVKDFQFKERARLDRILLDYGCLVYQTTTFNTRMEDKTMDNENTYLVNGNDSKTIDDLFDDANAIFGDDSASDNSGGYNDTGKEELTSTTEPIIDSLVAVKTINSPATLVPEDEKAIEDAESKMISQLKCSSSKIHQLYGYHRISPSIYASISTSNGKRSIKFIQQYSDGSLSGTVTISQSDLFTLCMALNMQANKSGEPLSKEELQILLSIQLAEEVRFLDLLVAI